MVNQSDFDLRQKATDEPRTAGVSQIRERARPASPYVKEEDRDPVLDWDTHHAGSLQLPATHKPQILVRSDPEVATSDEPQAGNRTATRDRADAFSLEVIPEVDDETEADDDEPPDGWQHDVSGEEQHTPVAPQPIASLRREPAPQPRHVTRRSAAALALGLAAVVVAALIVLSGHSAHHTVTAAASLGTRSPLPTNPLTTAPTHITKPTSSKRHAKPTAPRTPIHTTNRNPQHSRDHKTTSARAHTNTHAASTVEHSPVYTTPTHTAPVYTAPTQTTPTSVSTPPTGSSSSSPSTTSSSGSSGSSGTHTSAPAKQPAFGPTGTLGPGSSPNG
jgi:hypothetical protein